MFPKSASRGKVALCVGGLIVGVAFAAAYVAKESHHTGLRDRLRALESRKVSAFNEAEIARQNFEQTGDRAYLEQWKRHLEDSTDAALEILKLQNGE